MSTVQEHKARAREVYTTDSELIVALDDGRTLVVPIAWFPRLSYGTTEERVDVNILGDGVALYWPQLDEEIGIDGLLLGRKSLESDRSLAQWQVEMDRRRQSPGQHAWGEILPMPENILPDEKDTVTSVGIEQRKSYSIEIPLLYIPSASQIYWLKRRFSDAEIFSIDGVPYISLSKVAGSQAKASQDALKALQQIKIRARQRRKLGRQSSFRTPRKLTSYRKQKPDYK